MKRALVGFLGCALMLASMTTTVGAQYHGDDSDEPMSGETQSAFRFHVDTTLFRYAAQTTTVEVGDMSESQTATTIAVGNSHGFAGLFGTLSLGAGYSLSDAMVLGASMQLGYESLGSSESDATQGFLLIGFAPYFEYMGGDSSTKPFIGATVQVRHMSASSPAADGEPEETFGQTLIGGGLIGGGHFFMSDGCSIDLGAKLTYNVLASSKPKLADGMSVSIIDFLVTLGVSAWIL